MCWGIISDVCDKLVRNKMYNRIPMIEADKGRVATLRARLQAYVRA